MEIESLIGRKTIDHLGVEHTVVGINYATKDRGVLLKSATGEQSTTRLQTMVLHEDISQDEFGLKPEDRLTCHWCIAWVTPSHLASEIHRHNSRRSN